MIGVFHKVAEEMGIRFVASRCVGASMFCVMIDTDDDHVFSKYGERCRRLLPRSVWVSVVKGSDASHLALSKRKIKVRCTYEIEVEVPDNPSYDAHWDIEENHCPGTGIVGAAFDAHFKACEAKQVCWACTLKGSNEIVETKP